MSYVWDVKHNDMDKITHIYLYGDIINFQANDAEYYGCVSLTTVKNAFEANPDCDEIIVHIHSPGGDCFEGFAIHDYLINTGKKITTIVEGLCASIATVIFLAGSVRQLTENSRFLIHNPWTCTEGTADELEAVAEELRDEQIKILDFYVTKTGGDVAELQALMNEDIIIKPARAKALGFATEIIETVAAIQASRSASRNLLILNSIKSNSKKMKTEKKTKLQGITASFKKLQADFKALIGEDDVQDATSNSVTLDDDTVIYFAEDAIAVDVDVFTDEALTIPVADGDYTMKDGQTLTITDGAVESIAPAPSAETDAEIIARLTNELAASNAQRDENELLASTNGEALEQATAILARVKSSGWKPQAREVQAAKPGKPAAAGKDAGKGQANGSLKDNVRALRDERKNAIKK